MLPKDYSSMSIQEFSVYVYLGCSKEERTYKQEVRFSVDIDFKIPPKGELTDNLTDTLCYFEVCKLLEAYVSSREFKLIEVMSYNCLGLLKNKFPDTFITMTTHKVTPPVPNLRGGVKYVCRG